MPAFPASLPRPFSIFFFLSVFVSLRESVREIHARFTLVVSLQRIQRNSYDLSWFPLLPFFYFFAKAQESSI
jgi:hypothetical protein